MEIQTYLAPRFDYEHQAWTAIQDRDGQIARRYVRCGHPDAMRCGCYGREHAGEIVPMTVDLH